jgi:hypothetical protein
VEAAVVTKRRRLGSAVSSRFIAFLVEAGPTVPHDLKAYRIRRPLFMGRGRARPLRTGPEIG